MAAAILLLLAALSACPAQEAPRRGTTPARVRSPQELPRAPEGRWKDWKPSDPVPQALEADLQRAMLLYLQAHDHPGALEVLHGLLEREPDFPPALYQAGAASFRLRRYGHAAELFERFLAAAPGEVGATQALGHCYYSLGRYPEALAHYERVLAAAPEAVEALRGLALSHLRLGAAERALELLERVLEARPDHAEAVLWKAHVLYELERCEEALEVALRARELAPFEPRPHFLLGQVLDELGQSEEAARVQRRFAELSILDQKVRTLEGQLLSDPRRRDVHLRLVALHKAAGDARGVRNALERLLASEPSLDNHVLALEGLMELREKDAAARVALRIEARFADQAPAWRCLRDYHAWAGDRVRQVQAGERYLRLGGDPAR